METLLFILLLIPLVKGVCMALKPRKKRKAYQARPAAENKITDNLNVLTALQQQREQIQDTILYLKEAITTAETPEKTMRYMDRLSSLYGKLATVEKNIKKLTG